MTTKAKAEVLGAKAEEPVEGAVEDTTQYVVFEAEVVNKADDYLDIKYSRNNDVGELDKSYFAVSRFASTAVKNFDDVSQGDTNLAIEQSALTEVLIRYEEIKTPAE